MSKLVYGVNGQISFNDENEKKEAFQYLRPKISKWYIEPNDKNGAWAPEHRIYVGKDAPDCLKRQRTNGNRINCKELFEDLHNQFCK